MFYLIKKDFLLIKNYFYAMCAILAVIPFLIMKSTDLKSIENIGFIYVGTFILILMVQYLAVKDFQFPKAEVLICALPYSKKQLVIARYCFCIGASFLVAYLFALETYFLTGIQLVYLETVVLQLFITLCFASVYFPIQYRYGYEKTRFIFLVGILTLTFGSNRLNIKGLPLKLTVTQFTLFGLGVGMILLILSICLSIKIYENKDL